MGPLSVENKLLVDERTTKLKLNNLKPNNIINFKTIRSKLTALSNILHSILSYKLMRPLSVLRLQKQ